MSAPRPGVAITDAGSKALSTDLGLPEVKGRPELRLAKLSEEHGRLSLAGGAKLGLGEKVEFLPSHCCTTVNLHERAYAVRGGRAEEVWAITGRGRSQ